MTMLGRYELLGELGVGGMARVHLARAVGEGGFERLVAIKVLHSHLSREEAFVAMFLDEARLAARIRHPNVVSTIDIQSAQGTRFLVMDYVEGMALNGLLRRLAPERLTLEIALRIQLDLLAGLQAAHELKDEMGRSLGLVHRDISPHNVLVGKDGMSRITDFGIARAESRLSSTASGEFKGKVPYMAPEQVIGEEVDARVDVYAAGLVLWEMLAGRRLVTGDNNAAVMQRILNGVYTPASVERPGIPAPIEAVLKRSLARSLEERFRSALEFAEELEAAAHQTGVRIATSRAVAGLVTAMIPPRTPADEESLPEGRGSGVATKLDGLEDPQRQAETIAGISGAGGSSSAGTSRGRSMIVGASALIGAAIAIAIVGFGGAGKSPASPATSLDAAKEGAKTTDSTSAPTSAAGLDGKPTQAPTAIPSSTSSAASSSPPPPLVTPVPPSSDRRRPPPQPSSTSPKRAGDFLPGGL